MSQDAPDNIRLMANPDWYECYHNIARLVDGLRSGQYAQGNGGRLRYEGDLYSVGGVACDIYASITHVGKWVKYVKYDHWLFEVGRLRAGGLPPPVVVNWFGLERIQPRVSLSYLEFMAASGHTFAEIGEHLIGIYFPAQGVGEETIE